MNHKIVTWVAVVGMIASVIGWSYSAGKRARDITELQARTDKLEMDMKSLIPQVSETNAKLSLLLDHFGIVKPDAKASTPK